MPRIKPKDTTVKVEIATVKSKAELKPEPKPEPKITEADQFQQVNKILIENPTAVRIEHTKRAGKFIYAWVSETKEDIDARAQVRKILNEIWQSSATNYYTLAAKLRLDLKEVQALMDVQAQANWGMTT